MLDGVKVVDVYRHWILREDDVCIYQPETRRLKGDGQFSPCIRIPMVEGKHQSALVQLEHTSALTKNP